MSQYGVCIRSVFEQNIGPYEVCIFVKMGPFGKNTDLSDVGTSASLQAMSKCPKLQKFGNLFGFI